MGSQYSPIPITATPIIPIKSLRCSEEKANARKIEQVPVVVPQAVVEVPVVVGMLRIFMDRVMVKIKPVTATEKGGVNDGRWPGPGRKQLTGDNHKAQPPRLRARLQRPEGRTLNEPWS